ncbi:MAG: integrase [Burkholderiales bacterium RIFCSPHIGHO2_12_FULL_69_20]|nr:MAG: integrase [Burkholderiales bacterium RIFCSPHIGHO2_12_FULL_69_20]
MPLTDTECRNAKCPEGRPLIRLADAGGLYLEVSRPGPRNPAGSKLWRWKYRFNGKEKRLALGAYPDVPLASRTDAPKAGGTARTLKGARQLRDEARALLVAGTDPGEARRDAKLAKMTAYETTFEPLARRWWADWKTGKTERYSDYVLRRLELDAFPVLGSKPVASLTAPAFVRMAKAIEARGAGELARRVLETCGQVMRWTVAHGLAERNPVADVKPGDVLKPRTVENFARVGAAELPELMRHINAYEGALPTRMALRLMALTFVRTSELIEAQWREFDLDAAEWTIPPERTGRKGSAGNRRPHLVPLAPQAIEVLRLLQTARGADRCIGTAQVFPGERDHERPMSNGAILMALKRMGYRGRMTGHGFRGIASTALNEMGFRTDVIEAQLSHVEGNRVRAAYNHAQYLEERRELMNAWADYLDAVQRTGKVIPFRQAAQARKVAA